MVAAVGSWSQGPLAAAWMLSGAVCTIVYKALKHATARLRPCERRRDLHLTVAPLDRFSFPSGHTLHAVYYHFGRLLLPGLAYLLWPFTIFVAASRLVLGLHFISDVLAGAAIGAVVAMLALPCTRFSLALFLNFEGKL